MPDALLDAYREAEYDVHLKKGTVTLGLGATSYGATDALPVVSLTVVTGYNPGSSRPGDEANRTANRRLEHRLLQLGNIYHPADGHSRDRSHSEPSFAVENLSRDEARDLGGLFSQACVFYWERGCGELLWCDAPADP